jgi:hypothetical protein
MKRPLSFAVVAAGAALVAFAACGPKSDTTASDNSAEGTPVAQVTDTVAATPTQRSSRRTRASAAPSTSPRRRAASTWSPTSRA